MSQHELQEDGGSTALAPERPQTKPPRKFAVIMVNDDFTPMDFVVEMLTSVFGMSDSQATRVMLDIHEKGSGVAGVYTREIAETKIAIVRAAAQREEHPLMCQMTEA